MCVIYRGARAQNASVLLSLAEVDEVASELELTQQKFHKVDTELNSLQATVSR